MDKRIASDAELIERLGGSSAVADLLNFDKKSGGAQRVNNWKKRGIPAQVKVDHQEIFLRQSQPEEAGA